jgi:thiol-disulfide isomerase/thioredoxin
MLVPVRSKAAKAKGRSKGLGTAEKIIAVLIIAVVIWAAYSFSQPSQPQTTTTRSGEAPDFTLPAVGPNGLTGQSVSLSSFRGKVVLLEFMVPSCSHCQNMAPLLEKLYQKYGPENVVFLSVSGSWNGENANDAAGFIQNYRSSWTYVYDSSNSVFNLYGVNATPTFFVISKDGRVVDSIQGEVAYDTLDADLTRWNA